MSLILLFTSVLNHFSCVLYTEKWLSHWLPKSNSHAYVVSADTPFSLCSTFALSCYSTWEALVPLVWHKHLNHLMLAITDVSAENEPPLLPAIVCQQFSLTAPCFNLWNSKDHIKIVIKSKEILGLLSYEALHYTTSIAILSTSMPF